MEYQILWELIDRREKMKQFVKTANDHTHVANPALSHHIFCIYLKIPNNMVKLEIRKYIPFLKLLQFGKLLFKKNI